ncbi:MAG: SCO family protein [Rhodobacteraceae bacterium]|nr:SCO family protein [Paracoccaceae bacterium]
MKPAVIYAVSSVVAVGLGLGGYFAFAVPQQDQFAQCRTTTIAGNSQIGAPFTLTDHTGTRVTDTDVIDGLTLMYFGYTFCPDVCPMDTARNARAVDILEENGIMVKPVMITIDPVRDDPETLGYFVNYVHPRMVGLTGSEEEIRAVAQAYKVYYDKEDDPEDEEFYLVSHSTNAYLMAPEYGLLQFFTRVSRPEAMAETIACYAGVINGE